MAPRCDHIVVQRFGSPDGMRSAAWNARVFRACWLFILFVSVVDGYLVLSNRHLIAEMELNPVGRLLIEMNRGDIWYLLIAKLVGTILCGAFLTLIFETRPRVGVVIATVVATLQLGLLAFLTCY